MAASAPAQHGGSGCFVLLVEKTTRDKFLVDMGAVFQFFLFLQVTCLLPTGLRITTTESSLIPCWGWVEWGLCAGGICYSWRFLRAKVAFSILGADFLESFDLVVDLCHRRLIRKKGGHIQLVSPVGGSSFSKCGI